MNPIPMLPPVGGINYSIPPMALRSPQSEYLYNFNTTAGGVELRNGDAVYRTLSLDLADQFVKRLFPYGDDELFVMYYDSSAGAMVIYDIENGGVAYTSAAAGAAMNFYPQQFNGYLFFLTDDAAYAPGFYYDGATFGVATFTGSGLSPDAGGNDFNQRIYIPESGEPAYWYGNISAIGGALTKVNLSPLVRPGVTLTSTSAFTLAAQLQAEPIQTFMFDDGSLFFYRGSYPNSATWARAGLAKVGAPVSNGTSTVSYQGDALLLCKNGVISSRELFSRGAYDATNLSINNRIQPAYAEIIEQDGGGAGTAPIGVWDDKNARLIICFPRYFYFFVFDTLRQSWMTHQSAGYPLPFGAYPINDMIYWQEKVLMQCVVNSSTPQLCIWEKEGASGFTDRRYDDAAESGYNYIIQSAPISNGNAFVQKGAGMDVILESDLYAETNYQLIANFGTQTTTAQTIPSQPSGVQIPFVNMGIEGSYIQYKINGTTTSGKTVGYKLYGTNFWIEQGDAPR